MNLFVEVTLPVKFSREAQSQIVHMPEADCEQVVHRGKCVQFGCIAISASLKLQKTMGYRARTTLDISWAEAVSRTEARSDFLAFLQKQGLSPKSIDEYGLLFDNALAFDERGILV